MHNLKVEKVRDLLSHTSSVIRNVPNGHLTLTPSYCTLSQKRNTMLKTRIIILFTKFQHIVLSEL